MKLKKLLVLFALAALTGCQTENDDVSSQSSKKSLKVQFGYKSKFFSAPTTGRNGRSLTINTMVKNKNRMVSNAGDGGSKKEDEVKVATSTITPDKIVVTIKKRVKKQKGKEIIDTVKTIYKDKVINFDTKKFLSEQLELKSGPGRYLLTGFKVLDKDDNIIYLSPIEGSEMAPYVSDPLPMEFTVRLGETKKVISEVLSVEDFQDKFSESELKSTSSVLEKFGYTYSSFSYKIVKTTAFDMVVFGNYDYEMLPFHLKISSTTKYKEGGGTEHVEEKVFIDKELETSIWRVKIPNTYTGFHIVVSSNSHDTKEYSKSLEWLKEHDNFHHSELSKEEQTKRIWQIFLDMEDLGSLNLVEIPDENFRGYLKGVLPGNAFPDYGDKLNINHTNVKKLTRIDVSKKEIKSLEGIQYFTGLTYLNCNENKITTLDFSKNKALIELHCSKNLLSRLYVAGNDNLISLSCVDSDLSSLDLSKNSKLTTLYCGNNNIKTLNLTQNSKLEILRCNDNQIQDLDLSNNSKLYSLWSYHNPLKTLDMRKMRLWKSGGIALLDIDGNNNNDDDATKLTTLRVHENLKNHEHIKGIKGKNKNMTIHTYDDSCKETCSNYNPNDGRCH